MTTDSTNTMEQFNRWNVFNSQETAHTYSKAGKYTVSLTVRNAKDINTKTISGYTVVSKNEHLRLKTVNSEKRGNRGPVRIREYGSG